MAGSGRGVQVRIPWQRRRPGTGATCINCPRQLNCHPRRILDFSASLVPFGPPRSLGRVLRRALRDHVVPYPDPAYQVLREAIAQAHGLDPGRVLPGNGAAELFTWAARDAQSLISLLPTPALRTTNGPWPPGG